jgi:methionine biosynthesis protein MetW
MMTHNHPLRSDWQLIAHMIRPKARVLDIGCGDGGLMVLLKQTCQVDVRGLEIRPERVNTAVARGLSVVQGNAEEEVFSYPDHSFDYVIMSQTLQATRCPDIMLQELLRVGRRVIVSIPNFAYWKLRFYLLLKGTMPMSSVLDTPWYRTENIHLCTLKDFITLTEEKNIVIEQAYSLTKGYSKPLGPTIGWSNWVAEQGVFLLRQKESL